MMTWNLRREVTSALFSPLVPSQPHSSPDMSTEAHRDPDEPIASTSKLSQNTDQAEKKFKDQGVCSTLLLSISADQ